MIEGRKGVSRNARPESAGFVRRFMSFLRRRRMQNLLDLASPPDAESLFEILEVGERAGFDGRNNLPPSSEESIAGFQREIVDYHRKLQDKARNKVKKLAARLLAAARRADPSEVTDRLRDVPSKCQNDIDRVLSEFGSKMTFLAEQEASAQQDQDDGEEQRSENDLVRLVSNVIVFVLMFAVTGATAVTLGSKLIWGADAEPLLTAGLATGVAALAVVIPFLVAVGVSNRRSVPRDRQRSAFRSALFLITVFLSLVALFCAHLINVSPDTSAFTANDVAAARNAMVTDPGAIVANFDALKGLGVVMVVGFLGFLLGTQAVGKDAANGNSRAAQLRICGERKELTGQLRKQINKAVDSAEKEVNASVKRFQRQHKKLSRFAEQANDTQVLYDDFLAGLEESCNLLLERYRQTNSAARNTDIPPSFSEQICFRMEGASRRLFFEEGIERYRKSDNAMKDLADTAADVRRKLRDLNKGSIQSLEAVESHEEDGAHAFSTVSPVSG
jgi:uncharacterized membrane protein YhaH (DUF805 family)